MVKPIACLGLLASILFSPMPAGASDASQPQGEPVLDRPTLHSLGGYWIIRGDENKNATIRVEYRKAGERAWREGPPMFRVEKGAHVDKQFGTLLEVPADAWLFAGSIVLLQPATSYELKLTLSDPDGRDVTRTLTARTIAEPVAPQGRLYHVVPGDGGGSGSEADPFRGLAAAETSARPGDTFLLHAGIYNGPFTLRKSGEKEAPIVWRAAGDGEAIIDGQGSADERPERGIDANGVHNRWFESLTIRNARHAIVAHESGRFVVRRCYIHSVECGITATKNRGDAVNEWFITDNVMVGPSTWPRSKGIEDARGVQLTGSGHVIAYNRISGFADAIDTMPSPRCEAIDIHNNDISEMTDDGIETDYSQRNVRVWHNRLTNVFQGISTQPVYGGPVYIFRNTMYNVSIEPFKMHNGPSGALMYHNTIVKAGIPHLVWTPKPIHNMVSRNNLFIGTDGGENRRGAIDFTSPAVDCDFDYDGFAGTGPFPYFLRWNGVKYETFEEMKRKAPVYRNAVLVDGEKVFASSTQAPESDQLQVDRDSVDLRLNPGSEAVDAGQLLRGFNDDFAGAGPDLGAHEVGAALPHYGPRDRQTVQVQLQ